MKSTLLFLIIFFLNSHLGWSQTLDENEFTARLNRLNARLSIANQSRKADFSELGLTEQQKDSLASLRKRHQNALLEFREFPADEKEEAKQFLMSEMETLEEELMRRILLPHQETAVNDLLLKRNLSVYGGNLVRVVLGGYRDKFGLGKEQVKELEKLNDEVQEKIKAAKAKFDLEIEEIRKETQGDLRKCLTEKQCKMLEEMNFLEPVEKNR